MAEIASLIFAFRFSVVLLFFCVLVFEVVQFSSVLPSYVKKMANKGCFTFVSFLYVLVSEGVRSPLVCPVREDRVAFFFLYVLVC